MLPNLCEIGQLKKTKVHWYSVHDKIINYFGFDGILPYLGRREKEKRDEKKK